MLVWDGIIIWGFSVQVECTGPAVFEEWKGPKILLAVGCCSLKGGRADMLVEKATELGAWGLIPVLSSRSSVGHFAEIKTAHYL